MSAGLLGTLLAVLAGLGVATWRAPRLTAILVWSLLASVLGSAALLLTVPFAFGELALWVALSVPLLWASSQFWCYWDTRAWRPAVGLIGVTLAGTATVLLVPPPV